MEHFEKYYTSALYFLTRRPRSIKEVHDNLRKKNAPPEVIEAVITQLLKQKYLDDVAFAIWWREQRTRVRAKSDSFIKLELAQKGVSKSDIEKAFTEENDELISDLEKAKLLLVKQIKKVEGLSRPEKVQKLTGYLSRRGFSYETCRRAIDDALANAV